MGGLEQRQLLRLATAGSVDDGKSTLVGRLLYDSKSVLADQLEAVERASQHRGLPGADLALLTDGLRAEREQGITIDVAYRYFSTARRAFVLADTPGHVQYTRNMVTGASTAELALILVDARKGLLEQTRRHAAVAALLRVPHVVLAVNKMDLVDWDRAVFDRIAGDFAVHARGLGIADVVAIPLSALDGGNVVERAGQTPWYAGPTLLEHLEAVPVERDPGSEAFRLPIQYVIRPRTPEHPDYRAYAGRIASGVVRVGDAVVAQPSGARTSVVGIDTADGRLAEAFAPQSVALLLADDLDLSRGDLLADATEPGAAVRTLQGAVCWLADEPRPPRTRVLVKAGARTVRALIDGYATRLDITTLERHADPEPLALNEIGDVRLTLAEPLPIDDYSAHRHTGGFLVIDEADGATLAAGMAGVPAGGVPRG